MSTDEPERYDVRLSEAAEADIDAIVYAMMGRLPALAGRWHGGLLNAIASLAMFPHRYALAPNSYGYVQPVRAFTYGKGRSAYKVIYAVLESTGSDQPIVRVLRVIHASRSMADPNEES